MCRILSLKESLNLTNKNYISYQYFYLKLKGDLLWKKLKRF
jgi:hypothetical protein